MKSYIIVLFFVSLSVGLHGQTSRNLAIGTLYSDLMGITAELSYGHPISRNIGLVGRVSYNSIESYGVRGGLYYRLLNRNPISLDLGAEYNYDRHASRNLHDPIVSRNIEFPLTLNLRISNSLDLYGGIASSVNINNSESNRIVDSFRLGIKYILKK